MKKLILVFAAVSVSILTFAQQNKTDLQKAEALLKQMTIEEKVIMKMKN